MNYNKFAIIYDNLMYDCDYEKWSQYLLSEVNSLNKENYSGVELACGTGTLTIAMKKAGLDIFGIDISEDMVDIAKSKTKKENEKIEYIVGDACSFVSAKPLDFATMCLDSVSYIEKDKLQILFNNIYASLSEDSIFLFDISSEYKLLNYISDNVFYEDADDITYLWTNEIAEDESWVQFDIAFFVKNNEGTYNRFDEEHKLYVYSKEEIIFALKKAGFCEIKTRNDKFQEGALDKSFRLLFSARKKNG